MLKRLTKRNPEKRRHYKKCRMALTLIRPANSIARRPDKTLAMCRHPAVTKQYSAVGRIRLFASPSGSHKTVPVRRPDKTFHRRHPAVTKTVPARRSDKMLRVAIRQSQNSTCRRPDKTLRVAIRQSKQYPPVGRIRRFRVAIRQSQNSTCS